MTMLAAVLNDFNLLELQKIPIPEPGPGEALVRIKSCGFCATDFKAIKGIRRNVRFPLIPGHEPAGVIAKIGPMAAGDGGRETGNPVPGRPSPVAVRPFREGDEVILMPSGYCGLCRNCRLGLTHYCENAFTTGGDGPDDVRPGSFAEYTVTALSSLFHKPAGISFDAACQTEPVSGAWKGLIQNSQISVGDDVVIIGTGGIGMYCLMVAKAAGAGTLIAVDVSEFALETARKLGATHTVNPSTCDARQAVYDILPGGPDLVVEAAGPIEAVRLMVSLLRRGTRWNVFGITTHETFELDGGLMHFLEARMDSSFGTTPLAMEKSIRLMARGLIDPERVISHRFPLSKIHQAVDVMASPERNKVIVNP